MNPSRQASIPDEHLDHVRAVPLRDQPATRLRGSLQAERPPDPYHQIFRGLDHPKAVSFTEARAVVERNGLRLPAAYARPSPVTPIGLLHSPKRSSVLDLLAVLMSYGAVTNNQAAAFTGDLAYADPHSPLVADLFRSGLIALSPAYSQFGLGSVGHGAAVYKLASRKKVRELRDHLTYAEWVSVTGGRPPGIGPVHIRHDALAAELALRSAQLQRVGTVLGPHFSMLEELTLMSAHAGKTKGGPDLTIVRDDGLRIAVEITATIGKSFVQKVDRWAKTLAANPFGQSGLMVIFLAAPSVEDQNDRGDWPRRDIYGAVARAAKDFPGRPGDRTADRMGAATWREWFPDSLVATERFTSLTVDRPTGREPLWETCDLLDTATLRIDPASRRDRRSVIASAALLAQTPPEVRLPHRPADLYVDVLRMAASTVPSVAPLRERSATRAPGAGQGVAGDSYIPERLLGTTTVARTPRQRINSAARRATEWPIPPRRVNRRSTPSSPASPT